MQQIYNSSTSKINHLVRSSMAHIAKLSSGQLFFHGIVYYYYYYVPSNSAGDEDCDL